MIFSAIRPILAGDEITINYGGRDSREPVDFDLTKATPLEKNPDPERGFFTEQKQRIFWRQVQADIGGKGFDLRPIIGKEPASAYLLTYVYSPKAQKVQLQLQSDEKLRLWHNDKSIEHLEMTPLTLTHG